MSNQESNPSKAHIHILGIAGIGMSGIAKLFHSLGYRVTGSDLLKNASTDDLEQLGIKCYQGHSEENLIQELRKNEDFALVCSSAIDLSENNKNPNPEVCFTLENQLNLFTRAEALAEIAIKLNTIAITGTHGKTTTTSLVNEIFSSAGLDPSFLIGGLPRNIGKNAHLGGSDWFLVEADESDATFLYFRPHIAVITNIDDDHLEFYDHDIEKLKNCFVDFIRNLGINDYAVICGEDQHIQSITHRMHRNLITYGFSNHCTLFAQSIELNRLDSQFLVISNQLGLNDHFQIKLPGRHNILNSLAAIACAKLAGIETAKIQKALSEFDGVKRRFESLGHLAIDSNNQAENLKIELIDDYAHHPEEILFTLQAAKNRYPNHRIVAIFQPHRYSRTATLINRFADALSLADQLVLLPIFSAGEINHQNIHNQDIINLIKKSHPNFQATVILDDRFNPLSVREKAKYLKAQLSPLLKQQDVIIAMGAGTIRSIVEKMLD